MLHLARFTCWPTNHTCHLQTSCPPASSFTAAKSLIPPACAPFHEPSVNPASTIEQSFPIAAPQNQSAAVVPIYQKSPSDTMGTEMFFCRKHSWKVDSNEFTSVYVKRTFSIRLGYLPTGNMVDRWMNTKPERIA